jgi:hypothetical protein
MTKKKFIEILMDPDGGWNYYSNIVFDQIIETIKCFNPNFLDNIDKDGEQTIIVPFDLKKYVKCNPSVCKYEGDRDKTCNFNLCDDETNIEIKNFIGEACKEMCGTIIPKGYPQEVSRSDDDILSVSEIGKMCYATAIYAGFKSYIEIVTEKSNRHVVIGDIILNPVKNIISCNIGISDFPLYV